MNQSSDIGTIGTFTQIGAKLVGSDTSASANEVRTSGNSRSRQGVSVSVYGDTLAVGGYWDNNYTGATWIFTRNEGIWTQQGPKLVGSDGIGRQFQGRSVSLYGDTLAVGGFGDNNYTGATWIFTRNEGVWIQQGPKLVGSDGIGEQFQGFSVSLYGDTLAVCGTYDNNGIGATWIFTRTNGVWTQQGSKLVESDTSASANEVRTSTSTSANEVRTSDTVGSYQDRSVSLYGDTLAVSGIEDNNFIGATWIFTRSEGVWTQQGSKLVGSTSASEVRTSGTVESYQGVSLSLYGDTLAVGGFMDNNTGAIWIFTRSEGIWTQQGPKLVGPDGAGFSVSLYGDTLAVGGDMSNNNTDTTWIFTRNEGVWTKQDSKLVGSDYINNGYQGSSVSLYGDTLAVGGLGDNNLTGATWIFQNITCGIAK